MHSTPQSAGGSSAGRFARVVALTLCVTSHVPAAVYRFDTGELIPGTEDVEIVPGANLSGRQLVNADFRDADLTDADLSRANLRDARFIHAHVNNADFTDSNIIGASFNFVFDLTPSQLYSTASYRRGNLRGVEFYYSNVSGFALNGQDLRGSNFHKASVHGTDFTDARIEGAILNEMVGMTKDQIFSTASYKGRNLQAVNFGTDTRLAGWDFSGQDLSFAGFGGTNLTNASFRNAKLNYAGLSFARLTGADFTNAEVTGASLIYATQNGFTPNHLYATQNYAEKSLRGVALAGNDLSGWDFHGQDMTGVSLAQADVTDTDFAGSTIAHANLRASNITSVQLYATKSYQTQSLQGIDLTQVSLLNWDFREQDLSGAAFGYTVTDCCYESPLIGNVDFRNAKLNAARIESFNGDNDGFSSVNFSGADLSSADLATAYFLDGATFSSDTIYNQWTVFPRGFDPVAKGLTLVPSEVGDFDGDGTLSADDLQRLVSRLGNGTASERYDVNDDNVVDREDVRIWVTELRGTTFGDADLNGRFDGGDLIAVFAAGEYEDWGRRNSSWATGDWDGDGEFTSGDLVVALADGGYEAGAVTVPEPAGVALAMAAVAVVTTLHRRCPKTRRK